MRDSLLLALAGADARRYALMLRRRASSRKVADDEIVLLAADMPTNQVRQPYEAILIALDALSSTSGEEVLGKKTSNEVSAEGFCGILYRRVSGISLRPYNQGNSYCPPPYKRGVASGWEGGGRAPLDIRNFVF